MKREIARTARMTLPVRRRVKEPGQPVRHEDNGTVSGTVVLEVDSDAVLRMLAEKALRSKGGKAVLGRGAIVVRAINRKREGATA